jgi:hypothetical protein
MNLIELQIKESDGYLYVLALYLVVVTAILTFQIVLVLTVMAQILEVFSSSIY